MPTIADLCTKEKVWINYRTKEGEVVSEIVEIDSKYHTNMKTGKPFNIASRKGLIGLVDIPGTDGGLWAATSLAEFQELSRKAEQRREEIAEQEAWMKIIEDEENSWVRHKPRVDRSFKLDPNDPYEHVVVFHNHFESNRRRH